jgi:hypothetical protein
MKTAISEEIVKEFRGKKISIEELKAKRKEIALRRFKVRLEKKR